MSAVIQLDNTVRGVLRQLASLKAFFENMSFFGIGFDWGITKPDLEAIWKVRFEDLCEFKTKFGHCSVLKESSANPKLGNWVSKQRYNYKRYQEGKPSPMTAERIRELESILFNWDPQKQLNFHDS